MRLGMRCRLSPTADAPFARLDEVLSAKAALDAELRDYVRARVAEPGVAVAELGARKSKSW